MSDEEAGEQPEDTTEADIALIRDMARTEARLELEHERHAQLECLLERIATALEALVKPKAKRRKR